MATGVQTWSETAATNATIDTNINWAEGMAPSAVNDSARAMMASVAKWRDDNNGTIITAGTSGALTLVTNQVEAALTAGYTVKLQFGSAVDTAATLAVDGLTAKPLQTLPGVPVIAGQYLSGAIASFTYSTTGTGQWISNGPAGAVSTSSSTNVVGTSITNSIAANVALSNTANYFDGPSVAQGTVGTWFASGTVTIGSVNAGPFGAKLWDGTTVIAVTEGQIPSGFGGNILSLSLSGVITSPAGNIRISVRDPNINTSNILAGVTSSVTSSTNASTITAVRIA